MQLSMDGSGTPNYDPVTQDLYLYNETNTGDPIAWNPNCVVYKYREYLETRRAKPRDFFNPVGFPEPPGTTLSQKPNYWNNLGVGSNTAPYIFANANRGIFCSHYWSSDGYKRLNLYVSNIQSWTYTLKFLNLNNELVTLDNTKLKFGWEWIENIPGGFAPQWTLQNKKMPQDYSIWEYEGTEMVGKKFPKVTKISEIAPDSFESIFVIDSQDKVLFVNVNDSLSIAKTSNIGFPATYDRYGIIYGQFFGNKIISITVGDSGSQLYGIKNGVVYFLGHFDAPSFQYRRNDIPGDNHWVPDFNDPIVGLKYSTPPLTKKIANNATISTIKQKLKNIKEALQ